MPSLDGTCQHPDPPARVPNDFVEYVIPTDFQPPGHDFQPPLMPAHWLDAVSESDADDEAYQQALFADALMHAA